MGKMRVVVLGLAVGSAVLAGLLAKGYIGRKAPTEVVEINKVVMSDVLVASRDMQMGERLADGAVAWRQWPRDNVSAAMITRGEQPDAREEFAKARARLAIFEGEPIVEKKLVLPNQTGFMSAMLPKGMRAISVAISVRSSAGGFILPDDRVDVILTRKYNDPQTNQQVVDSETVLTNVKVLAINQTYRPDETGDKATVAEGKTATLELDPRQSEIISMVESSGELSLSLRSMAENDGVNLADSGPKLAERYNSGKKKGTAEGDLLYVRYGIETISSSR
ncbi:MAG: Flp pilus assembly protein CpaB [Hyphomicrobiales bacterium]